MTRTHSRTATGMVIALLLTLNLVASSHAQDPVVPAGGEAVSSVSTAFTYQGRLNKAGAPANTTCNFRFSLWDAATGGGQWGATVQVNNVAVREGLFTVRLDFGNVFFGDGRWLQTAVRCAGDASFTPLRPRSPLTGVPYALALRPGTSVETEQSPAGGFAFSARNFGDGTGLYGFSDNEYGVSGETNDGRAAVYALSRSAAAGDSGVLGEAHAPGTRGVEGYSANGEAGVYGETGNENGSGVYGKANGGGAAGIFGTNESGVGVWGNSTDWLGVYGYSYEGAAGVYGETIYGGSGVYGKASVAGAAGVYGRNEEGTGVWGYTPDVGASGVYGESDGPNGNGVYGLAKAGRSYGVWGESRGEYGRGVYGLATGFGGYGLWGETRDTSVYAVGVRGGAPAGSAGWAGYFDGKLGSSGAVYAAGGAMQLDHPLDPANRTLSHAFVESPEMKSFYDGVVTTDAEGLAVVELPAYVEALNTDFRYQLTVIGEFAQAIIGEKIANGRFTIRTDRPNIEVSWLVTGIRNDGWARQNRVQAEEWKPAADRGRYLHPEAFGQPASKAVPRNQPAALQAPAPVEPLGAGPASTADGEGSAGE